MAKLSRREKETIITFNEQDPEATIFTYSQRWKDRIEELGIEAIDSNQFGGLTYKVPKKAIRMPVIRKSRQLNDKERQAIRERLVAGKAAKDKKPKRAERVVEAMEPEPP